jgi:hypothetical protein
MLHVLSQHRHLPARFLHSPFCMYSLLHSRSRAATTTQAVQHACIGGNETRGSTRVGPGESNECYYDASVHASVMPNWGSTVSPPHGYRASQQLVCVNQTSLPCDLTRMTSVSPHPGFQQPETRIATGKSRINHGTVP